MAEERTYRDSDGKDHRVRITDYHDFTDIDTPAAERRRLGVGDIWINAAKCGKCGDTPRSCNRHDMHSCSCGDISVDGGSFYCKMSYREGATWEGASVSFRDVEDNHDG